MDLVFAPSQIETWPIDRLRPYARNAKIHGTDQVAKIAASMAKFGWTVPCMVADDGELIAGHGRVLAAAMLGLKDVPVIRLSHLDEAERRAYRIADNKLTELGEWDEAMLRDEIAGLLAEDFDLTLLGITDEDLDALLRDPDQLEGGAVEGEDDIPEPPVTPVSLTGDIWQLGSPPTPYGSSLLACEDGSTWPHPAQNVPQNRSCREKCRSPRVDVIIRDGTYKECLINAFGCARWRPDLLGRCETGFWRLISLFWARLWAVLQILGRLIPMPSASAGPRTSCRARTA
jgi:hypothetical protein